MGRSLAIWCICTCFLSLPYAQANVGCSCAHVHPLLVTCSTTVERSRLFSPFPAITHLLFGLTHLLLSMGNHSQYRILITTPIQRATQSREELNFNSLSAAILTATLFYVYLTKWFEAGLSHSRMVCVHEWSLGYLNFINIH